MKLTKLKSLVARHGNKALVLAAATAAASVMGAEVAYAGVLVTAVQKVPLSNSLKLFI
jgi:hypothetical protein